MLDLFKKTMFTGLGLALLTKEKMDELVNEVVAKGDLSEKEGKEFFAELSQKSKEAKLKLEEQIRNVVRDSLEKMDLATKDDLKVLEGRISELAAAIKDRQAGE